MIIHLISQVRFRWRGGYATFAGPSYRDFMELHIQQVDAQLPVPEQFSPAQQNLADLSHLQARHYRRGEGRVAQLFLDPFPFHPVR